MKREQEMDEGIESIQRLGWLNEQTWVGPQLRQPLSAWTLEGWRTHFSDGAKKVLRAFVRAQL